MRRLDEGVEDVSTYGAYARHLHELLDFLVLAAQPEHVQAGCFLGRERSIQHIVQALQHFAPIFVRQLGEVMLAVLGIKDARTIHAQHSGPVVLRLDSALLAYLLIAQIQIELYAVLEHSPMPLIGMKDRLELVQSQQPAQVVGILPVVLVRAAADERVLARITDDELVHIVPQRAREPVCQRRLLQSQGHFACLDRYDVAYKRCFRGWQPFAEEQLAARVHAGQHAMADTGVQAKVHPLSHLTPPGDMVRRL